MEAIRKLRDTAAIRWFVAHKRMFGAIVLVASLALAILYVAHHPEIEHSLRHTNTWVLLALTVLYSGMIAVNIGITQMTIKLCRKDLPLKNTAILSVYSSIVNFFGPLQSGPGVRAVYLKARIGLRVRDYTYTMLFYYLIFGFVNASLLFVTTAPILTALGIIAGTVLLVAGTRRFHFADRSRYILAIYFITVFQVLLTSGIYYTELHATGTPANWAHTLVYSASANLSLFVSLTPGGIGIREAFLLFTQSLHGISPSGIVAAGILDRAFYISFLVVLLLVTSAFHIKDAIVPKHKRQAVRNSP